MSRNKKIDRRLVGNYDKQDKQFYFIIQKWNIEKEIYENVSTFETERCEVNGLKEQYE
jgi:helix-turn-helix protein